MVLTEMPWASSARPSSANSSGREGPTLAWPSDSRTTRLSRRWLLVLGDLGRALQHARVDGGRAAGTDLADEVGEERRCRDILCRHQHVDPVVEDHDRGDIGGKQPVDRHDGGLARLRDGVALHGARSVDDERHVDGRAVLRRLRLATLQGDAQVVLVALATLHHGLRQPRLESDRLTGLGGKRKERVANKEGAHSDCAICHGPNPMVERLPDIHYRARVGESGVKW